LEYNFMLKSAVSFRSSQEPVCDNSKACLNNRFYSTVETLGICVVLFVAFSATSCGKDSSKSNVRAATNQSVSVAVAPAVRYEMPIYINGLGSVTPLYEVNIRTRVDGQLAEVAFKEGQHVNKGDLLAVVDPRPFEVALSQAQAQLFRDQAQLRDAQLNYQRFKDLLEQSGAMSQQQVDTQRATMDQLEGAVRSDQATIDNAKLNLIYCHITSPISGRVGLRLVDPGNMVHAADANPLLVVTQLQPITVIFTLPEDQLSGVSRRMKQGTLEADVYSRDDRTKIATGKLLTIDNQIDQTTGTGRLKAIFDNKDDSLWPNQFVNVHLLLNVIKDAVVVPAAAVQRGQQGNYVFVMKQDKTVEVRPVTVNVSQNNLTSIKSGLNANEIVVTDGQDKLQAGSRVEPRGSGGNRQRDSENSAPSTTSPAS
jgi:membrane fusion protein, multidrug efflux system